ncbi:MAG: hypothetical protein WAQ57_03440 [Candidatus Saccharimonadales bacterium]
MTESASWPGPERWTDGDYITSMFEDARDLASRMDALSVPVREADLDDDFEAGMEALAGIAELYTGYQFTFEGTGLGPVWDQLGRPFTAYGQFAGGSGVFDGFHLYDASVTDHINAQHVSEPADVTLANLEDPEDFYDNYRRLQETLDTPPEGLRLCARFVAGVQSGDLEVAGPAFRTKEIRVVYMMDAASLHVTTAEPIELKADPSTYLQDLHCAAAEYELLLNRETFRNRPAAGQARLLGDYLNRSKGELFSADFDVELSAATVLANLQTPDGLSLGRYDLQYGGENFWARVAGIDVLERIGIDDGLPLGPQAPAVGPESGFCMVVEISDEVRDSLGLQSNIVWVPVRQPGLKANFYPRDTAYWF